MPFEYAILGTSTRLLLILTFFPKIFDTVLLGYGLIPNDVDNPRKPAFIQYDRTEFWSNHAV